MASSYSISSMILMALVVISLSVYLSSSNDLITSLPGQQTSVNFTQRSGYVVVDYKQERALFYYLVEAEIDPLSKPLLLWLTGGPGCSSVGVGAFSEHGPFWPKGNVLTTNQFSWNKVANMLYLDSPAGVGFSYSKNKSFYGYIDDEITAQDNMVFLEKWVAENPDYDNRDIFLAGESYGGHFVPQLANMVLKSSLKSNLKGILIGNPLLEFGTDFNSRGTFLWSHGLISDETLELLTTTCNFSRLHSEIIYNNNVLSPACSMVSDQADIEIGLLVDMFDISSGFCESASLDLHVFHPMVGVDLCISGETVTYLNRKDVQKALHAKIGKWDICTTVAHYDMRQMVEVNALPVIATLIKSGIRVLLYSGDQDSILPFLGTRSLVKKLAKELVLKRTNYRNWLHGREVGGWAEEYGNLLSVATIRGAGHEVPFTQPAKSLALFRKFVKGQSICIAS